MVPDSGRIEDTARDSGMLLGEAARLDLHTRSTSSNAAAFDLWRAFAGSLWSVDPTDDPRDGFAFAGSLWSLGSMMVARYQAIGATETYRDRAWIEGETAEYLQVSLRHHDVQHIALPDGETEVQPGDVMISDLRERVTTRERCQASLDVLIPRAMLDARLGVPGHVAGSRIFRCGSRENALLADHLRHLAASLDRTPAADAPLVAERMADVLAHTLIPVREQAPDVAPGAAGSLRERMAAYIHAHLGSPRLTVATVCAAFGIARSYAHRLFQDHGGMSHYIRACRLERVAHALCQVNQRHLRVIDIAARFGFTSEAHFSRLFREHVGLTPGQVRAAADSGRPVPAVHRMRQPTHLFRHLPDGDAPEQRSF